MITRLALLALLTFGLASPSWSTVSREPARPDEVVARALEMVRSDRLEDAIVVLEPVAWQGSATEVRRGLLGALYLEAGQATDALAVLRPLAESESADPAVLFNAWRAALASGQRDRGEVYLVRSADAAPGSPATRELGLLRGIQGLYPDSFLLLRSWIERNPEDAEARLAAAYCAVQMERAGMADELLAGLPVEHPRVRLLRGRIQLLEGDPQSALATLRPLLSELPVERQTDLRRALGQASLELGRSDEAVEFLEGQVLDSPEVALQMSRAQFQKGDARAALSTLEPFASVLLEGRADSRLSEMLAADLLVEHGRLLIAVGRQEDAVLGLDRAAELVPEDKRVWQVLGQALAEAGRREEARQAVERFIRIVDAEMPVGPRESRSIAAEDDPTAKQLREAMRLLGKDRAEEALALVRQEAELVPEDPRPRIVESRALLMLRRPEAALAAAEQAIAIAPSHPDGYYQRGVVRMTLEDDAAEADFRHALEILPTHTPAMDDLAVWLMKEGRNKEARQLLERALQLNPNDAVARRNLARLDQISAGYGFSIGRDP